MQRNIFRKSVTAAAIVGGLSVPTSAFALESFVQIAITKAAEYAQVLAKEAAMLASWTYDKTQNLLTKQSGMESIVGAVEKGVAGTKELTQAGINYAAAQATNQRFVQAQDLFTAPSARPAQVCELIGATGAAAAAVNDAKEIAASSTAEFATLGLSVENSKQEIKHVLDNYRTSYCTPEDVQRGFCATAASNPSLQGAAVQAATLLIPMANETYSEEEVKAATDYVKLLTNPAAPELLPKGIDGNSKAAKTFNRELMSFQAKMSMAQYSLNSILGSKTPYTNLSSSALGDAPSPLSAVGLMKELVEKKHGNGSYKAALHGMEENALLQEMVLQMAGRNWMDFQAYSQQERIEGVIAMQLSILAGERNDRQLALARNAMSGGR